MQEQKTTKKESAIVATVIVSESELRKVYNLSEPVSEDSIFNKILFDMGLDTNRTVTRQDGLWHRNRLNEVVLCSRWIGEERQDNEWITSGYASQEAKDKAKCNRMLDDLYRSKNLTKDTQQVLEERDRYTIIDETVW